MISIGRSIVEIFLRKIVAMMRNEYYIHHYYKDAIDEKSILIISKVGEDLAGNMYRILLETTGARYQEYHVSIMVTRNSYQKISEMLSHANINNVEFVRENTTRYYRRLNRAKFIFIDTTLPVMYIKKEGQVITNTWHGTPLKKLGVDVKNRIYAQGNTISCLNMSDYIVFPNQYMCDRMSQAYELNNIYQGKILLEGYPRNSVFFDDQAGKDIRQQLKIQDKQVFVYMPTWRGTLSEIKSEEQQTFLRSFLKDLDEKLSEEQVLYVKLHPFVKGELDIKAFIHIKEYPSQYDVYDFLNISDGLVTDYSSIMFDYANKGKKIILFLYDKEEYEKKHGIYFPLSELPFPQVYTAGEMVDAFNSRILYDNQEFLKKYCTYDRPHAEYYLCQHIINNKKSCKEINAFSNKKPNVLIYMCGLIRNGITTSFLSLINSMDTDKRNYYMCFEGSSYIESDAFERIRNPIHYYPLKKPGPITVMEAVALRLYKKDRLFVKWLYNYVDRFFFREKKYCFSNLDFSYAINYVGYNYYTIRLLQELNAKRLIYVHNDMLQECRTKRAICKSALISGYKNYDSIVAVSGNLNKSIIALGGSKDKIRVIYHYVDDVRIRLEGQEKPEFNINTESNYSLEEITEWIEDKKTKTIVTCGRFSEEKNHITFIHAFERFAKEHPDFQLLIIGGYGVKYKETLKCAQNADARVILIKGLDNPHAFVARCDLFVLPSLYEGLGLVILEADAVGLPVVTTDVVGPRDVMRKYEGLMVEPTQEELYKCMKKFVKGEIPMLHIDFQEYNRKASDAFEGLFV